MTGVPATSSAINSGLVGQIAMPDLYDDPDEGGYSQGWGPGTSWPAACGTRTGTCRESARGQALARILAPNRVT
jgi:hypothetical protein